MAGLGLYKARKGRWLTIKSFWKSGIQVDMNYILNCKDEEYAELIFAMEG